jgi:oxidoreductase
MSSTALLIGATGLVGKHLLPQLLESTQFSQVGEFGRRVTSFPESNPNPKLQQRVIDFEKLSEAGLKDGSWDVIYITLGTTKAIAGSKAAFTKIDKE